VCGGDVFWGVEKLTGKTWGGIVGGKKVKRSQKNKLLGCRGWEEVLSAIKQ